MNPVKKIEYTVSSISSKVKGRLIMYDVLLNAMNNGQKDNKYMEMYQDFQEKYVQYQKMLSELNKDTKVIKENLFGKPYRLF